MSDHSLIQIIWNRPSLHNKWRQLSDEGRRRVLTIANGSDFMLAEIVEDIYEIEREESK